MNKSLIVPLAAVTLAVAAAGLAQAAEPLQPYRVKGQVIQRLNAFDNPEGSIFSADGRFVFISNAAELGMPDKGFHLTHKAGYISKLAVQPDGTLKMVNEKLITGLTGPFGMAVSPVATRKFPKGTVFLIEAWAPLAEADGTEVKDPSVLDPKIIAFNTDGKILGAIKMGAGSPAAAAAGVTATMENAEAQRIEIEERSSSFPTFPIRAQSLSGLEDSMESFDDLRALAFSVWSKDACCARQSDDHLSGRSSCWL